MISVSIRKVHFVMLTRLVEHANANKSKKACTRYSDDILGKLIERELKRVKAKEKARRLT